jgi:Ca2+-binding EF-hand superfamily protein
MGIVLSTVRSVCPICDDDKPFSETTASSSLTPVASDAASGASGAPERTRRESAHGGGKHEHQTPSQTKCHTYLMDMKQNLIDIFILIDEKNTGKVTKEQLAKALANNAHAKKLLKGAMHAAGLGVSKAEKNEGLPALVMRSLDDDKDGFITKAQFFKKLYAEVNIVKIFHDYDIDDDGCLSKSEFDNMMNGDPEIELMMEGVGVATDSVGLFSQFDPSNSGRVSCIDFLHKIHLHSRLVDVFMSVDKNGDGEISSSELHAAISKDESLDEIMAECKVHGDWFKQLVGKKGKGNITLDSFLTRLKNADHTVVPKPAATCCASSSCTPGAGSINSSAVLA